MMNRIRAGVAIGLGAFAMSPCFGAVSVTASRDYVDRKIAVVANDITNANTRITMVANAVTNVSTNVISRIERTVVEPGVVTDYVQTNGVGGVRILIDPNGQTNLTQYGYEKVTVRRNGVDDPYKFDISDEDGYGIVRKKDLEAIIRIVVTNMMGNVYWNSPDGGQTLDAYYREGDTVSNIVSQVNAYLRAEGGKMSVYSAPENAPQPDSPSEPAEPAEPNEGNNQ